MKKIVRMFVGIFVFMAMVGFVFPMILSAMAQVLFPVQAQGSLIIQENTIKGSSLVGQNFKENDEQRINVKYLAKEMDHALSIHRTLPSWILLLETTVYRSLS